MATKSLVLRVRVTDVLMAALEEESSRLGVSVSKLVRSRLEGRSFGDVSVPRPSASQVAKRSFKPDFK